MPLLKEELFTRPVRIAGQEWDVAVPPHRGLQDQKALRTEDTCPQCGGPAVGWCRCFLHDCHCANGHEWHLCPLHRVVVTGSGHGKGHGRGSCSCGGSKALGTGEEIAQGLDAAADILASVFTDEELQHILDMPLESPGSEEDEEAPEPGAKGVKEYVEKRDKRGYRVCMQDGIRVPCPPKNEPEEDDGTPKGRIAEDYQEGDEDLEEAEEAPDQPEQIGWSSLSTALNDITDLFSSKTRQPGDVARVAFNLLLLSVGELTNLKQKVGRRPDPDRKKKAEAVLKRIEEVKAKQMEKRATKKRVEDAKNTIREAKRAIQEEKAAERKKKKEAVQEQKDAARKEKEEAKQKREEERHQIEMEKEKVKLEIEKAKLNREKAKLEKVKGEKKAVVPPKVKTPEAPA